MMSFRDHRLERMPLTNGTVWLLTDIAEATGRQEGLLARSPEVVERLRRSALIQSVESSNRIEGVEVSADRLEPLVIGDARPRDRSEEEVQGYRRALSLVHEHAAELAVTSETVRRLHRLAQEGAGDAGEWKARDNEIVEFPPGGGPPVVRFTPVSAKETPAAMDELCRWYTHSVDQRKVQPLVAVAAVVLDVLCVHPFRDGNGRVARLLGLLGLYHAGYTVGRYVSIERLIEQSKEDYYENLRRSSQGWHEGRHDLGPWLNYFLVVLRRAYVELAEKARAAE